MLKEKKLLNLRGFRSFRDNNEGFIFTIIALIVFMIILIWLIGTIVSMIIPLAIFLILAIIFAVIIKKLFFGGESLGITKSIFGVGKEAGRQTVGMIKGSNSEYKQYKEGKGGW